MAARVEGLDVPLLGLVVRFTLTINSDADANSFEIGITPNR
ncbi:MAG: hypothetical protein PUP91_03420 [Rhizonema sp. PD37]|nr:hypothetical protein [Rhizonema sp. PD37]